MKKFLSVAVIGAALALPAAAQADYRTGNTWQVTSPGAQRALIGYRVIIDGRYYPVAAARCKGDRTGTYAIDRARGFYHHLWCGVAVRGSTAGYAVDFWQTGQGKYDYRLSNFQLFR